MRLFLIATREVYGMAGTRMLQMARCCFQHCIEWKMEDKRRTAPTRSPFTSCPNLSRAPTSVSVPKLPSINTLHPPPSYSSHLRPLFNSTHQHPRYVGTTSGHDASDICLVLDVFVPMCTLAKVSDTERGHRRGSRAFCRFSRCEAL